MKAIAWKDVPIGSFVTTKSDLNMPPNSRYVWKKIDSDGYFNCESVSDGNKSRVGDLEWECYICNINGNLIEEKKVSQKTIKFRDIKVGQYFRQPDNLNVYVWQKASSTVSSANSVCVKSRPKDPDMPHVTHIDDNAEFVLCDKDGNLLEIWKTFDEMEYGEYYELYDDRIGLRIKDGVLILKSYYNNGKIYYLDKHQVDRSIKRKIINRPDDVKLP